MIKKIIKILLIGFFILILVVFYLSIFGIKTDKFNYRITKNILNINKNINLKLNQVNYKLNPYNFSINIKTKKPQLLLEGSKLGIKNIKTNISLKSLINNQFSINDLEIHTKEIKLNDVIKLARSFKNSPQLFMLDTFTKSGLVTAKINLIFDRRGKIKKNYQIKGSIKNAKFNFLNKFKLQNLNFDFEIDQNNYLLKQIDTKLNNIKISSPLIDINKKNKIYFVKGLILSDNKKFNIKEYQKIYVDLFNNIDIKKIEFSTKNEFSFNMKSNLKFNNLKVETTIDLKQLIFNSKYLKLKSYFPSFVEGVKFEKHKIKINYHKNKYDIKGNGNILLEDKSDSLSYHVTKNNNHITFDSKIKLISNPLSIDFLEYKKKEGHSSLILVKGNFKKDNKLKFDLISLNEKNNQISVKGLDLNKNFKIIDMKSFNINYKNDKKILNKLNIKKNNSKFIIEGESFDATELINKIMDTDEESLSIFHDLNTKISIKIKKTYIDEYNYINNLYGNINFNNNKINDLKLDSAFPNNKKINLSIKTNNNFETITKLSTDYPKPLIKRYNFIQGFEEGYLDFYSNKRGGVTNSVLIIDNFKIKKVPIFAKLLSLASLQGIADLLTGEGIRFTDFEMNFTNYKGITKIEEMYAIGPAVSLLMNGYIESDKIVSLKGTLVPATTINRTIASIPILGKILIGDKVGEGVFGVSFKVKGTQKDLKTTVNPIKTLTPRFIIRTLENIKKN